MSEEIKKEAQDVELNPENLDKVAGGFGDYKCPFCGKTFLFESQLEHHFPCEIISDDPGKIISD